MEFQEKRLYQQIHPLKLATDVSSAVASFYFLWNHRILWAAPVAFVPPIVVSAIMIAGPFNLEWCKHSEFGRYLRLHMTPAAEAT